LNFKFEFVFVFQPFDIRIQASPIRHRWFCLESGALCGALCDDFFVLCWPPIQATPAVCLLTLRLPSPPCIPVRRSVTLRLRLRPWRVLYTDASYQSDKSWWPRHRDEINWRQ